MGLFIMDIGIMIFNREVACSQTQMELSTRVSGIKARKVEKEFYKFLTEIYITAVSKTIKSQDRELLNVQTEIDMRANGLTIKYTVKELLKGITEIIIVDSGKITAFLATE